MKSLTFTRSFGALLLALVLISVPARASTITWSSIFNDSLFNNNGQPLDDTFSFEVGSFGAFVPTIYNVDQWVANWKVFDAVFAPDVNGWNSVDQFFVGLATHDTAGHSDSPDANPTHVFAMGEQVYLWAYNSKVIAPTSEWALVTDLNAPSNPSWPWLIPDPADTASSFEWQLADADSAIWGGVNGIRGAGDFGATPALFSLQTAVVPEPGSVILLLAAAAAHVIRRARHSTRTRML